MADKNKLNEVNTMETGVHGQYKNWFLDYASYVILERAVPYIDDGLKPVQRRILHAMKEMDDGRLNKAANIIGQTMQYHPHGDASIQDAMVNIGQKNLLIDTQGNWGDSRTGDAAAAPRYIEARLSKFALEVAFNAKTTQWQLSYDGRKREPVALPMKFPLVLAQGAEGIAVGLSTKILPHNFCELIDATIKYLRGQPFQLFPDFFNGGIIDAENYNDGKRGGKIRCRAHIEEVDKKTIVIRDVPYGTTTTQLMDSIVKANDQGKIKIKKVTDNTAKDVEIAIELSPGITPDSTIDALYAFTDCEVSISPNTCVIVDNKPVFTTVSELLKISSDRTTYLLQRELEIKLQELEDKWHYTSLEKIFFEEKIYKELEKKHEAWENVIEAIAKAFQPFLKKMKRDITRDDILKLTEKPVRRIYKLDIDELNAQIKAIEAEIQETKHHLAHLIDYAVAYFESLLAKYGKGRERKSILKTFDVIQARQVAIANTKIYINRADGFIGTSLKKDELIAECSDLDDIIVFTRRGIMKVVRVGDKVYIGKDIIHAAVFQKNDERMTYNMIYTDGESNVTYAKRFSVTAITRDKDYDLTKGHDKSKVNYFSVNPNGEAESVNITLSPNCSARNKSFEYFFEELEIKGRSSFGNQVTKYPVKSVKLKQKGLSTLSVKKIWYDATIGRLNTEAKGHYLGSFQPEDKIIVFYRSGNYEIKDTEISQRLDSDQIVLIEKFNPKKVIAAIYYDQEKNQYTAKRFRIETQTENNKFLCIREGEGNTLSMVTSFPDPIILILTGKGAQARTSKIKLAEFVEITGWKSIGIKLTEYNASTVLDWAHRTAEDDKQVELF